ncbi:MAG: hypothetical protein F6K19_15130 [Cyanothece sp. SIO1E1]|nr:hypothetical protein [Cyanothece sp. SIO1E1]
MDLVIGSVIAFLAGALSVYSWRQKKIDQKTYELVQSRRAAQAREQTYESRIQQTIKSLQVEHRQQLNHTTEALQQHHKTEIQTLEQRYLAEIEALKQTYTDQLQALEQSHQAQVQHLEQPNPIQQQQAIQTLLTPPAPQSDISDLPGACPQNTFNSDATASPAVPAKSSTTARKAENLDQAVAVLQDSGLTMGVIQWTQYITHPAGQIRQLTASTLGQVARLKTGGVALEQAVSMLDKLSQDLDPAVRESAITALENVKSERVIPVLEKALRDTNSDVVKAASAAFSKFKFYQLKPEPKPLPKPTQKPDA